ncbi:Uncharacterized protein dnm_041590 [Desulfonema magnum]|uniref:Uncharacterized protein n=1 Tax=Desulfonema magnum TaxID=45655 RepID=A0A975BN80_9BACT|nr:Uncharacterized protein dnm_041590 [Desulfonema magnum]
MKYACILFLMQKEFKECGYRFLKKVCLWQTRRFLLTLSDIFF